MTATPTSRERYERATTHAVEMAIRDAWGIARDNQHSLDSERITSLITQAVMRAVADVTQQLNECITERDKAIKARKAMRKDLIAVTKERDQLLADLVRLQRKSTHGCVDAMCEECDA